MNHSTSQLPGAGDGQLSGTTRVAESIDRFDWPALLAFTLPFCLYILTLAPTVYNLDSAELTTAAATGGIVRATGYPLYVVLGWFWSLLPIGDVGYRLNLFSAFCGALTILLAELSLRRLEVGGWARLLSLGLLVTAPYFWAMSLIAEVYTLHTALMASIIYLLLRWKQQSDPRHLLVATFLLGLSMGNHASTVLLLPGYAWLVIRTFRSVQGARTWALLPAAFLLGLSIYLYLPLRYLAQPAFNYAGHYNAQGNFVATDLTTLDGFLWLVTGRAFAGQMFGYRLGELGPQLTAFGRQLWQAFFAVGMGPGLLGAAVLLRRRSTTGTMLALMFLANVIFYVNYRVMDKNTMFLPAYLVWALWAGTGLQTIFSWLRQTSLLQVTHVLLLAILSVAIVWNGQRVNLADDWSTRRQSEAILEEVEEDAIILGWWDTIPGVQYLQLVEGQRPDVLPINRFLISGEDLRTLIEEESKRRPVYINSPPPDLLQTVKVSRVGTLYRLSP